MCLPGVIYWQIDLRRNDSSTGSWKYIRNKRGILRIHCKNDVRRGIFLKDYIEERAVEIADYIIENNATVRQTAKQFRISKSTVHMEVII